MGILLLWIKTAQTITLPQPKFRLIVSSVFLCKQWHSFIYYPIPEILVQIAILLVWVSSLRGFSNPFTDQKRLRLDKIHRDRFLVTSKYNSEFLCFAVTLPKQAKQSIDKIIFGLVFYFSSQRNLCRNSHTT